MVPFVSYSVCVCEGGGKGILGECNSCVAILTAKGWRFSGVMEEGSGVLELQNFGLCV